MSRLTLFSPIIYLTCSFCIILIYLSGLSSGAKNNVRLRIPQEQRMKCLAKLLCGIQSSQDGSSGVAVAGSVSKAAVSYVNQAQLLRKYFDTYEISEDAPKPSYKTGSSHSKSDEDEDYMDDDSHDSDDDDADDDESASDNEESGTSSDRKKFAEKKRKVAEQQQRERDIASKIQNKRKSSVFDTGVPIVEQGPKIQILKRFGRSTLNSEQLTFRRARELATKSTKNCNVIEGCSFTFKQIFVSLQEGSNNIMGNENIVAQSDQNPDQVPISEIKPKPVVATKSKPGFEDDDESPSILRIPLGETDTKKINEFPPIPKSTSPPAIIINDNEDDVENEDIKIYSGDAVKVPGGVQDLFLSTDPEFGGSSRKKKKPKTPSRRRPSSTSSLSSKKKKKVSTTTTTTTTSTTTPAPAPAPTRIRTTSPPGLFEASTRSRLKLGPAPTKKVISYNYQSSSTSKRKPLKTINIIDKIKLPQLHDDDDADEDDHDDQDELVQEQENDEESDGGQVQKNSNKKYSLAEKLNSRRKKRPSGVKKRPAFEQPEEDYDDSRDTYDEEAQFEINTDNDNYEDDLDEEVVTDYLDDHGKKGKKKKNKNKKKKNKKKKNKNKGGGGGGGHGGGWGAAHKQGYLNYGNQLTEIGGRPLAPTPESPHPALGIFSQSSGWATLYRKGDVSGQKPLTSAGSGSGNGNGGGGSGRNDNIIKDSIANYESSSTSTTAAPPKAGGSGSGGGGGFGDSSGAHNQYHQHQHNPNRGPDGQPNTSITGFSIKKLAAPFTNLVKLVQSG